MWKRESLTPPVLAIVRDAHTEAPFTDDRPPAATPGTFLCRQCGLALFRNTARFNAGCGWPAFMEALPQTVLEQKDPDGIRDEIHCARCGAHLGHVFRGEGFTPENLRHCVNAMSLDHVRSVSVLDSKEAIFAAGCFWGVEHLFKQLPGVLGTEVGYTGGEVPFPSYEKVCGGQTGHYEAVRILYDPMLVTYETLVKYFYEIHHPDQQNGQGPDIGQQYRSAVFFYDDGQKEIAEKITGKLRTSGCEVATRLLRVTVFWPAEDYHQNYYDKTGKHPYCHVWQPRF